MFTVCIAMAIYVVMYGNQDIEPIINITGWGIGHQADQIETENKCLIVILGQVRAADLTWPSFKEMLLDPSGCDLALSVGAENQKNKSNAFFAGFHRGVHEAGNITENPFYSHAKYVWSWDESHFGNVSDSDFWDKSFDHMLDLAKVHFPEQKWSTDWKKWLWKFGNQWRGPVGQPGSAGILLFMRLQAYFEMLDLGLFDKYEFMMYTRSDYKYLCPFPFEELTANSTATDRDTIWISTCCQGGGGITDRNLLTSGSQFKDTLDILLTMMRDPQSWHNTMNASSWTGFNLETVIQLHFERKHLMSKVKRYGQVMYNVRGNDTWTRWWFTGQWDPVQQLRIKYWGEWVQSKATCSKHSE